MLFIRNIRDLLCEEAKKLPIMLWFYIFGIGLLTIFLSSITPPMKGIDESSHFFRALQISKGQLFATKYADNVYGGDTNYKMSSYCSYMLNSKIIEQKTINDFNKIPEKQTIRNIFSTSATYSPLMYIPMASGLFIAEKLGFSVENRYIFGKICNIISYLLLLCLVVFILPFGRYITLFFFTTPAIISMAAYYNADTFVNLLTLLFIACCLRARTIEKSINILKYSLIILAISLGLLKITYCFFSLLLLLLPLRLFKNKVQFAIFVITTITVSILMAIIWNEFYKFTPGSVFNNTNNPVASLNMLKYHPLIVLKSILYTIKISAFTWSYDFYNRFVSAHSLIVLHDYSRYLFIIVLFLALFSEKTVWQPIWKSMFQVVISIGYCLIVFVAFYIGFSSVDSLVITGIQARYFIMPIILLLISIQCFIPNCYTSQKLINPLLIINFFCVVYVVMKAIPQIIS